MHAPWVLTLLLLCSVGHRAFAQPSPKTEAFQVVDQPVYRVLDRIGEHLGIKIYYDPATVPYSLISVRDRNGGTSDLLMQATIGTVIRVIPYDNKTYVALPERLVNGAAAEEIVQAWRRGDMRSPDDKVAVTQIVTVGSGTPSGAAVAFRGTITDQSSGEPLIGATVFEPATSLGTATEPDGTFALVLPAGQHRLTLGLLGYLDQPVDLTLVGEGQPARLSMQPTTIDFAEVIVSANSNQQQQRNAVRGLTVLSTRDLKALPTLGGELNVLLGLSSQAGVTSTSEGSSAISVRGGALDQNLVLQAGMPMLYPSHALGFYPAFHPDLVSGVELYKGYVPAEFGERAASVLEVNWRNGDLERWHARGSVGPFAARVSADGPLVKRHVSLIVGARQSYLNYALKRVRNNNVSTSAVSFADLSARVHGQWKGGGADLDVALTTDEFNYSASFGYDYSNALFGVAFRQNLRPDLLLSGRVGQSALRVNEFELRTIPGQFERSSGLTQQTGTAKLDYVGLEKLTLAGGLAFDRYVSEGRAQTPGETSPAPTFRIDDPGLNALAAFVETNWTPVDRLEVEAGFRVSAYQSTQPAGERRRYDGLPGTGAPVSLEVDGSSETVSLGTFLQPRLSLSYRLDPRSTLGVAYSRMSQPVHQLSATISPTPADIFFLSTNNIPVTTSHGYSLQYSRPAVRGTHPIGLDLGGYVRTTDDLLQTRDGRLLRESPRPEVAIYRAPGIAYGGEASITLAGLRNTLTVAYAYGRSFIDVDRRYPEMRFTDQTRLPTNTDLPHQLNVNYLASFSSRASFNLNYTFTSGRAFTPTDGYVLTNGVYVPTFGSPQEARLPPTHRVDLGFTIDNSENARRGLRVGFDLSVYNLLMRQNPFLAFYRPNDAGRLTAYQFALIGDAIPSFNINLQWD